MDADPELAKVADKYGNCSIHYFRRREDLEEFIKHDHVDTEKVSNLEYALLCFVLKQNTIVVIKDIVQRLLTLCTGKPTSWEIYRCITL